MVRLSSFKKGVLALALFFAAGFASAVFAQAPTGSIRGEVTDPSGAVVPGATVKVTEVATGRTLQLKSSAAGLYAANLLIPGEYKVRVEAPGFKAFEQPVVLRAGDVVDVNVKLEVGAPTTTIEVSVTAGEVRVDTTRSTVDGIITAEQVVQLPLNARNFLELAALEPGVLIRGGGDIDPTKSAAYRAVGILGRSGTSTRIQVDGIDVTDETVGTTTSNMSDDAVQEFQLSRSSLDLTTSLTSSGAISIISRSGSNDIHGSGFWYYRNQDMGARLQFLTEAPPFKRTQVGYRAGGPFLKNKLFWFSNWERTYQAEQGIYTSNPVFPNVPFGSSNNCSAGCSGGVPFDMRLVNERLDWNISSNVRAFYRFNHDMNLGTGGTIPVNPYQNVDWTNVHALGLDISSGRVSHSIRYGHVTFNNRIVSMEFAQYPFPETPQGIPYYLGVGAYALGPNGLAPQATAQNSNQTKYDGTLVVGRHTLRFGLEVNRIILGGFANFAGPLTVAGDYSESIRDDIAKAGGNTADPLSYPLVDFSGGPDNGFFTVDGCFKWAHGCHRNTRIAWYIGDAWKVRRNLSLNIGTRWEYDTGYFSDYTGVKIPAYMDYWLPGYTKIPQMGKNKFGPQFGFAWDPKGNGKTSIRGGYYLAYDMNIYNNLMFDMNAWLPAGIGPDLYSTSYWGRPDGTPITPELAGVSLSTLPASCQSSGAQAAMAGGDWSCLAGNPIGSVIGTLGAVDQTMKKAYAGYQFNPAVGDSQFMTSAGVTYGFQVGGDKFEIPYSMQYNIGVQHEIKPGHVLSVDFLYNHGYHMGFLGVDLECRRCASTLNVAKAQAKVNSVLNGQTVDGWIAAHPAATIASFGLATDAIYQGLTPDPNSSYPEIQDTNFLRNRTMLNGGVTTYTGLHIKMTGRLGQHLAVRDHPLVRSMNYTTSWAIGSAQATNGATRPEFLNNCMNKLDCHDKAYFGPNGLDRTHMITGGVILDTVGGFRFSQIWTLYTAPPINLWMPGIVVTGANRIFTTDLNGDGGGGSGAPFDHPVPGTHVGEFGRGINSWEDLNKVLNAYNSTYAGKITPAGQALVSAGIFTEDQLKTLGAVTPTIPLAVTTNPWPFMKQFNLDLGIGRPIHLKAHEAFVIEPWLQIFNVFNHTGYGTYGALGQVGWGSWSLDYRSAANEGACGGDCMAALTATRTRLISTRLLQIGVRVSF